MRVRRAAASGAVAARTAVGDSRTGVVASTTRETVDNPYGLGALWAQGDFVSRGTLIILVLMSMGSWYILVTKLYESLKINREAKAARKSFFKSASLRQRAADAEGGQRLPLHRRDAASRRASTTRER